MNLGGDFISCNSVAGRIHHHPLEGGGAHDRLALPDLGQILFANAVFSGKRVTRGQQLNFISTSTSNRIRCAYRNDVTTTLIRSDLAALLVLAFVLLKKNPGRLGADQEGTWDRNRSWDNKKDSCDGRMTVENRLATHPKNRQAAYLACPGMFEFVTFKLHN